MTKTLQELFDASTAGLIKQGKRAYDIQCAYRTDTGCMCAIGQLIPDDKYDPVWDKAYDPTVPDDDTDDSRALIESIDADPDDDRTVGFLMALQLAHDGATDDDFVADFKERANAVAAKYNLTPLT